MSRTQVKEPPKWLKVRGKIVEPKSLVGWRKFRKITPAEAVQMTDPFEVDTLEGTMRGKAWDYLVRGVRGELYPVDRGIFEATYVPEEGAR